MSKRTARQKERAKRKRAKATPRVLKVHCCNLPSTIIHDNYNKSACGSACTWYREEALHIRPPGRYTRLGIFKTAKVKPSVYEDDVLVDSGEREVELTRVDLGGPIVHREQWYSIPKELRCASCSCHVPRFAHHVAAAEEHKQVVEVMLLGVAKVFMNERASEEIVALRGVA